MGWVTASDDVADAQVKDGKAQADAPRGAVAYLRYQAHINPTPFISLVGKVLPLQVTGKDGERLDMPHSIVFVMAAQEQASTIDATPVIRVIAPAPGGPAV